MKDRLNAYIQGLFAEAERRSPANRRLAELKEELLLNTREKYDDLVAAGKSPEAAYRVAVDGIGDISELLDAVAGEDIVAPSVVSEGAATAQPSAARDAETPPNETNRDDRDGEDDGDEDDDNDDDDDDDGEEKRPGRPPRSRWYALVSGIIWTVILCLYFWVSFETHAWSVTWLLFLMGIAADNVARCIFDLRR